MKLTEEESAKLSEEHLSAKKEHDRQVRDLRLEISLVGSIVDKREEQVS